MSFRQDHARTNNLKRDDDAKITSSRLGARARACGSRSRSRGRRPSRWTSTMVGNGRPGGSTRLL